jgi:uncharacterized protein with ParB-like and HNH nuclease domain
MIYTIRNIFNAKNTEGVLAQNSAVQYYIAPYQRGYKWKSVTKDDSVCLLMKDLLDAAENPGGEYYLQFITTKLSEVNEQKVLEVIDGQQRLTTLTLLLSVLAYKSNSGVAAISNNLLSYEVRPSVTLFFQNHIYTNIESIIYNTWEQFLKLHPGANEQDIYYLFNAAKKINEILDERKVKIIEVETYILDNVKIILNNIERNINCEEMFSNLNDNKIELTSAELIKGLFLTKSARENTENRITYKEILEIRAVMGRQWDDLAHWSNRKEIKSFYFENSSDVLDKLLLLLATADGYEGTENNENNAVFNFFQSRIKKGDLTTSKYFTDLKRLKHLLNDWYHDTQIHNLMGFMFFARGRRFIVGDTLELMNLTKSEIRSWLQTEILKLLPDDISLLEYGIDNGTLHNTLLALSVFNGNNKFDFHSFSNSKMSWSLEHIFPQNPEELSNTLKEKDLKILNTLAKGKTNEFEKVRNKLSDFEESMELEKTYNSLCSKLKMKECELTLNEKKILYRIIRIEKLNNFGNMALLTKSDNSSNKNGMFDKKRQNVARRVSAGSFVPKHTYDVFSKLVSDKMTPELSAWSASDIEIHEQWAKDKIQNIKNSFNELR